jgi:phosphohistidine phosphatase
MRDSHTLIVMRHAKAGELPGGPDLERALRPRGQRDSAAAGRWLAASGFRPDLVRCSAARRTRQTWRYLSEELGGKPEVSAERELYQADGDDVAELIRQTAEHIGTLMYIGHNPAAADLVGLLTGTEPEFPTAAVAVIGLTGGWADAAPGAGELIASWTPRSAGLGGSRSRAAGHQ